MTESTSKITQIAPIVLLFDLTGLSDNTNGSSPPSCASEKPPSDIWLFQVHSNRAKDKPISRVSVSRVFKEAGDTLGLSINTHSMRKSRGKAMYDANVPVEKIAKVLNHADTGVTLRYLGISKEDVLQTYDDFEL